MAKADISLHGFKNHGLCFFEKIRIARWYFNIWWFNSHCWNFQPPVGSIPWPSLFLLTFSKARAMTIDSFPARFFHRSWCSCRIKKQKEVEVQKQNVSWFFQVFEEDVRNEVPKRLKRPPGPSFPCSSWRPQSYLLGVKGKTKIKKRAKKSRTSRLPGQKLKT